MVAMFHMHTTTNILYNTFHMEISSSLETGVISPSVLLIKTATIGVPIAIRGTVIGERRRLSGIVAAVMPNIVVVLNLSLALTISRKVVVVFSEPYLMSSTTTHVTFLLMQMVHKQHQKQNHQQPKML